MRLALPLAASLLLVPARADDFNDKKSALCALGDIDGDGVPDLALASRDVQGQDFGEPVRMITGPADHVRERVWLISGANGSLIRTLLGSGDGDGFGSSLANAGDLDEDGVDDLVVGCIPPEWDRKWATTKSCVRVFSCKTGVQLFEVPAGSRREGLGFCVAGLGDVDGDGIPEFAAGAPFGAPLHASDDGKVFDWRPGFVRVYSGLDGALLYQVEGEKTGSWVGESFGTSICSLGDLDDDGRPDFAVSAPGRNMPVPPHETRSGEETWETEPRCGNGETGGSVLIFSGRLGREIGRIDRSSPFGYYGWTLAPAGDVDGDDQPDLLVGTLHANLDVVSGKTLKVIRRRPVERYHGGDPNGYSSSVASVGDVDADGVPDFVVGANEEGWAFDPGEVIAVNGRSGKRIWRFVVPRPEGSRFEAADALPMEGYDACGCGDVNGDRIADVAVVTQFSRELIFLSGRDGSRIRSVRIRGLER